MKWKMRIIDLLEFHRAKVYCKDGTVHIGVADCVFDASEGEHEELDGLLFHDKNGDCVLFDDEIEKYELLD